MLIDNEDRVFMSQGLMDIIDLKEETDTNRIYILATDKKLPVLSLKTKKSKVIIETKASLNILTEIKSISDFNINLFIENSDVSSLFNLGKVININVKNIYNNNCTLKFIIEKDEN